MLFEQLQKALLMHPPLEENLKVFFSFEQKKMKIK